MIENMIENMIASDLKPNRKFINNKSRGYKYLVQDLKRTQKQVAQIAQLPKKCELN